jgi:MFS family permease
MSKLHYVYRRKYRSWTLYILTFALTSLVAGLVYGWPALREQLLDDNSTLSESQLGIIFTIGSWSTQGGRFFVGLARDRFGTQRVLCSCMMLVVLGCVGIGVSDPDSVTSLTISLFLVGLGSGVQLTTQPVASLFPNHVGLTLSSLSGAFQVSGLIFLALTSRDASRIVSFLVYAGVLAALTVVAALFYPEGKSFLIEDIADSNDNSQQEESSDKADARLSQTETTAAPADDTESACMQGSQSQAPESGDAQDGEERGTYEGVEAMLGERKGLEETSEMSDGKQLSSESDNGSSDEPSDSLTAFQQIKTSEYVLLCAWFSICLIPLQYYVGSIGFQLEERGDETGFYTDLFAYTYAGATVSAPMSGFLADRCGLGVAQGVGTGLVAIAFFLLASYDLSLNVQAIGLVTYGVGRMAIFGIFFTNCGKRFGYGNYGTLAGLGLLISAIFSLLQYPLISLASEGYSSTINLVSGIVLCVQAPYFVWLFRRERRYVSANSKSW